MSLKAFKKSYSQLRCDCKGTFTLITSLRQFFRDRITMEQAQKQIERALESRDERFLKLVRTQVYENAKSPYLKLLTVASCDFPDLQTPHGPS
jgi:hypothetical protein